MVQKHGEIIKYSAFALVALVFSLLFVWAVKAEKIPIINLSAPAREEFEIKTEDEVLEDLLGEGDVSAIVQNEYEKYMASLPKAVENYTEGYIKGLTVIAHAENFANPQAGQNREMPACTTTVAIPAGYTCVGGENGVLLLCRDGKYGYFSETGSWLTAPDYDKAYAFSGGLAVAVKGNLYGVIDTEGKTVIPFLFDGIGDAETEGLTVFKKGEGYSRIVFVKKG